MSRPRPRSLHLAGFALALICGCSSKSSAPAAAEQNVPDEEPAAQGAREQAAAGPAPADAAASELESEAAGAQPPSPEPSKAAPGSAIGGSRLQLAEPMINGGYGRDIIRRKVLDHEDDLRACHARALAGNPDLYGTLAIELELDARGLVEDVSVGDASELDQRELVDCVLELMSTWSFAGDGEGEAKVELRIELGRPE